MHDATPQAAVKNGVLILKKLYRNSVSNLDDFVKSLSELPGRHERQLGQAGKATKHKILTMLA